jgi:hypothetical protein
MKKTQDICPVNAQDNPRYVHHVKIKPNPARGGSQPTVCDSMNNLEIPKKCAQILCTRITGLAFAINFRDINLSIFDNVTDIAMLWWIKRGATFDKPT